MRRLVVAGKKQALGVGVLMVLILTLSAFGGEGGQDAAKAEKGKKAAANSANVNPIVGTWRRERKCDELVRELKQAGLAEKIPEWVAGAEFGGASVSAEQVRRHSDPCQGLRNVNDQHDHVFYPDGPFESVNETGDVVDYAFYELPDERTLLFADGGPWSAGPDVTAHFRFSNDQDTVTFDLVLPEDMDKCSPQCRQVYAWAVSAFYPGLPWKRVPPEEQ